MTKTAGKLSTAQLYIQVCQLHILRAPQPAMRSQTRRHQSTMMCRIRAAGQLQAAQALLGANEAEQARERARLTTRLAQVHLAVSEHTCLRARICAPCDSDATLHACWS